MGIFLRQVSERFPNDYVVMFMDKAAWHTAGKLEVPENMRLEFLPPYSPELNPTEILWREIREKWFCNKVFANLDAVEDQLMDALVSMNQNPETVKTISSFDWIITCLKNAT